MFFVEHLSSIASNISGTGRRRLCTIVHCYRTGYRREKPAFCTASEEVALSVDNKCGGLRWTNYCSNLSKGQPSPLRADLDRLRCPIRPNFSDFGEFSTEIDRFGVFFAVSGQITTMAGDFAVPSLSVRRAFGAGVGLVDTTQTMSPVFRTPVSRSRQQRLCVPRQRCWQVGLSRFALSQASPVSSLSGFHPSLPSVGSRLRACRRCALRLHAACGRI